MSRVLLLVGGGKWHDTLEHRQAVLGLLKSSGQFDVTMTDDLTALSATNLAHYDAIVNYMTALEPTKEQIAALLGAVESGTGFVGLHAATATFYNSPEYLEMIGGKFVKHDKIKEFVVNIVDKDHPITEGVDDFSVEDELFVVDPYSDTRAWQILARAEAHPVIWNRSHGKGRVHYNALGHDVRSINNPSYRELVLRAVDWVQSA